MYVVLAAACHANQLPRRRCQGGIVCMYVLCMCYVYVLRPGAARAALRIYLNVLNRWYARAIRVC